MTYTISITGHRPHADYGYVEAEVTPKVRALVEELRAMGHNVSIAQINGVLL